MLRNYIDLPEVIAGLIGRFAPARDVQIQFCQNYIWVLHNLTQNTAEIKAMPEAEVANILKIFSKLLKLFSDQEDPVFEMQLREMAASLREISKVSKYVNASACIDQLDPDEIIVF